MRNSKFAVVKIKCLPYRRVPLLKVLIMISCNNCSLLWDSRKYVSKYSLWTKKKAGAPADLSGRVALDTERILQLSSTSCVQSVYCGHLSTDILRNDNRVGGGGGAATGASGTCAARHVRRVDHGVRGPQWQGDWWVWLLTALYTACSQEEVL